MMHNSNLVFCVKSDNKVLREHGENIYIPFGQEYSFYIKNLHSRRCQVSIEIDGKSISDGSKFIINANSSMDIERFLKSGNLNEGNRFKFIERTASIEKHRGVGAEDGLIRVEFEFEREYQNLNNYLQYPPGVRSWGGAAWQRGASGQSLGGDIQFGDAEIECSAGMPLGSASNEFLNVATAQSAGSAQLSARSVNDAGITVPGSMSNQQFRTVSDLYTDGIKHVMVLKLLGETETAPVVKAVTVKHKPTCVTCGKVNKANAKFCSECGTALQIF